MYIVICCFICKHNWIGSYIHMYLHALDIGEQRYMYNCTCTDEVINTVLFLLCVIKQIDYMLPCICSVIDQRRCQNVVRTSAHSASFYHILMSSVSYSCTKDRKKPRPDCPGHVN